MEKKDSKAPTLADQDIVSRITTKTKRVLSSKKYLTVTMALGLTDAVSVAGCRKLRSDSKAGCQADYKAGSCYGDAKTNCYDSDTGTYADSTSRCDSDYYHCDSDSYTCDSD